MNFTGKTALVTGAAVGIGRAVALKLAQEGANLVLVDVNTEKLSKLKAELKTYSDHVMICECDVTDENTVYEIIAKAEKVFGKIDILVNNAALWRCWAPFIDTPTDEWKKFIDVNIMGVVYFTKVVLPKMIENGYGRIINVSSVAGVYGNANMVHYSTTKGALIAMTKALAKEVADKGILVNCVSPGSVSPSDNHDMNYFEKSELSFMGRTGTDMENANLICFLASDEASYISGQNIQIDGCRKKL
ncbi:SDR family NAD(P)-dependent oxidoreductase [Bianquea renquensis]|jgi:short-chain dehydrogenase/reductase SDR|uniref:SDR family oxidoreductase n=1 Tax=Bianquea renquensis TaxID=2763661 RepID=A0A926DQT6_9FIRM|nr:SDR family NAD(P)-dependent oxidoreductase [Bianquea renquensis]MBC8542353.1 SDR family oxidoreductase [Bianquea renquensis]